MISELEKDSNPAAYYNTFKVSLTRDQQKALSSILPQAYSFQPYKATRSLDQQPLRTEVKPSKKKHSQLHPKEQKDPDYSASYVPPPKELPMVKLESTTGIPGGEAFYQCYLILKRLKKSIYSWPFKQPVDPKALRIPQYFSVVFEPMDLRTIEENLRKKAYDHSSEFHRDIYKMLMNSYKFNQKNSDVFNTTGDFEEEYLKIVKDAKEGKLQQPAESRVKLQDSAPADSHPIKESCPEPDRHLPSPLTPCSQPNHQLVFTQPNFAQNTFAIPPMHTQASQSEPSYNVPPSSVPVKQTRPYHKKDKHEKVQHKHPTKGHKEKEHRQTEKQKDKHEKPEKIEKIKQKERQKMIPEPMPVQITKEITKEQACKHEYIDPFLLFSQPSQEPVPVPSMEDHMIEFGVKQPGKHYRYDRHDRNDRNEVKHDKKHDTEEAEYSISNEHSKKTKNRLASERKDKKDKKHKKQDVIMESPSQMKELKESTQAENEKTAIFNNIQKKLTDLLKKLNQYQMPNKAKTKNIHKNPEGYEHPNFTNFTTITAAQKKKLAEKIFALPQRDLRYVIEICFRNKRNKERDEEGVYEIDLEKLDGKVLKELSNFVGMRVKKMKRQALKSKEQAREEEDDDVQEDEEELAEAADGDQDYEPDSSRSNQRGREEEEEPNLFHEPSGSCSNLLDHDGNFNDQNYVPVFEMIDSENGHHRRHHPGDEYEHQFNF